MGHLVGKDIYRELGKKVDSLSMRAPWNKEFHAILKELYSAEEADLVVRLPYGLSTIEEIEKTTGYPRIELERMLESLASRGLVMDLFMFGGYRYMISPLVVGIFEFTMMRTRGNLDSKTWAELFHTYLMGDDTFFRANFGSDQSVSPMRTIPHEDAFSESGYVEVLDYEKAAEIVNSSKKFAIGICSCRHEKLHNNEKKCDVPLDTCLSFGTAADYLVRHEMANEVSKSEMLESLSCSKEMGLVLNADNVRKRPSFICQCCSCCCNVLLGISTFGYPNVIVTSNYIVDSDDEVCAQCDECIEVCPIGALERHPLGYTKINKELCLGCGVCVLKCDTGALSLVKRKQRVLHPYDTFERVILQCLERGTLQNQIFKNPQSITHAFMRGFLGGFLKLSAVKSALMSETLRSRFLTAMRKMAH
ncbi:ATP-binding protein [candidate division KSB1 bacterium]